MYGLVPGSSQRSGVDLSTRAVQDSYKLNTDPILSSAVLKSKGLLATGNAFGVVVLWELETGAELRRLSGHAGTVSALAFSPDGKLLASGSSDRTIKLWNVEITLN